MTKDNKNWSLDRHIPLALVFAIFTQTAGAFWWASQVQYAVESNANNVEKNTNHIEKVLEKIDVNKRMSKDIAVINERIDTLTSLVKDRYSKREAAKDFKYLEDSIKRLEKKILIEKGKQKVNK